MERHLILLLALVAVGLGTATAVLRPGVFQLGQRSQPQLGSGITYRSGPHRRIGGGVVTPRPGGRGRWERFQGRGPGGAK